MKALTWALFLMIAVALGFASQVADRWLWPSLAPDFGFGLLKGIAAALIMGMIGRRLFDNSN
jgi:hypothetical protein